MGVEFKRGDRSRRPKEWEEMRSIKDNTGDVIKADNSVRERRGMLRGRRKKGRGSNRCLNNRMEKDGNLFRIKQRR